jgi:peroxiredoxin
MAQEHRPLKIGDVAPPFILRADAGEEIRLVDVLRSKTAMVVFIRGTW